MGDSTDDSDNESENGAEIDEAFRSEVKLALGDAAAVSDEVFFTHGCIFLFIQSKATLTAITLRVPSTAGKDSVPTAGGTYHV